MKIVIPGGSGQVGQVLARGLGKKRHDIVVLSRSTAALGRTVEWDGKSLGSWADEIDGADVVINLAGRSVNCRYTKKNLTQMMNSRVDSTRVVGQAIEQAERPPKVWLQASTATIYAHSFERANDEISGVIGGNEPDTPAYWKISIDIAEAWERTLAEANTPHTRKVALRSAMVMSPDKGGIFDTLLGMTRLGFGGAIAGGRQYVSWIHETDFVRCLEFLIERDDIDGAVNLASPNPLPQRAFMQDIRKAIGMPIGLPATAWMVKIGAVFMRTDAELILKSRRVVPGRLRSLAFEFDYPHWSDAVRELVATATG